MKPHPHLFKQSDFRSSTAAPLCVRSVDMAGRLAQPRAARGGGRALLITIVAASFLWLMVSAETVAVFAQAGGSSRCRSDTGDRHRYEPRARNRAQRQD